MNHEIIGAIRVLLARVQITGAEVPAFNRIMAALAEAEAPPNYAQAPRGSVVDLMDRALSNTGE